MFKKFSQDADVKEMARVKSSKARKILSSIKEQYTNLEEEQIGQVDPDELAGFALLQANPVHMQLCPGMEWCIPLLLVKYWISHVACVIWK